MRMSLRIWRHSNLDDRHLTEEAVSGIAGQIDRFEAVWRERLHGSNLSDDVHLRLHLLLSLNRWKQNQNMLGNVAILN